MLIAFIIKYSILKQVRIFFNLQNTNNDLIRHALRSLNTSTVRLQAECAQLEGSAERVRSCAYNMAKANKQLLTQFQ
jgi:G protein-coupled receptor kinase-interacting protein 1 C term.